MNYEEEVIGTLEEMKKLTDKLTKEQRDAMTAERKLTRKEAKLEEELKETIDTVSGRKRKIKGILINTVESRDLHMAEYRLVKIKNDLDYQKRKLRALQSLIKLKEATQ